MNRKIFRVTLSLLLLFVAGMGGYALFLQRQTDFLYGQLKKAYEQKDYAAAINFYRKISPGHRIFLSSAQTTAISRVAGDSLCETQQYSEAVTVLEHLLEKDFSSSSLLTPNDRIMLRFNLGQAYLEINATAKADRCFDDILKTIPANDARLLAVAYFWKGRCAAETRNWTGAENYYMRSIEKFKILLNAGNRDLIIDNLFWDYRWLLSCYYNSKQYDKAQNIAREISTLKSNGKCSDYMVAVYSGLMANALAGNDYPAALQYFNTGMELCRAATPNDEIIRAEGILLWLRAKMFFQNHDLPHAITTAETSVAKLQKGYGNTSPEVKNVLQNLEKWRRSR